RSELAGRPQRHHGAFGRFAIARLERRLQRAKLLAFHPVLLCRMPAPCRMAPAAASASGMTGSRGGRSARWGIGPDGAARRASGQSNSASMSFWLIAVPLAAPFAVGGGLFAAAAGGAFGSAAGCF